MPTITSEVIPNHIPKGQRARLIKMQQAKVTRQLKGMRFVWECQTLDEVTPFDANLKRVGMTKSFVSALNSMSIKWRVNCYILSRERNGKNKLTDFEVLIESQVKHCEISAMIADALYQEVELFRESVAAKTFISAAWIAHEINTETTLEQAHQIFEEIGAWKLPTDGEEECQYTQQN